MEGFDDFLGGDPPTQTFSFKNFLQPKNVYFLNHGLKSTSDNIRALTKHNVTQNASCLTKE